MTPARSSVIAMLLAAGACGGRVTVDPADSPTAAAATSTATSTGAGGADGGSLPPCQTTNDCWGAEACQQGVCCAGVYENGVCTCGAEPGCDLVHVCCKPSGMGPDAGLTCVAADLAVSQCGGLP